MMAMLKVLTHMLTIPIMIHRQEIFSWDMIQQLKPSQPLFKILCHLKMDISCSASHSACLILHLYSNGDSIASNKMMLTEDFP